MKPPRISALTVAAVAALTAGGCAHRAAYVPPAISAPAAYKENANWKPAQAGDTAVRGDWWEMFGDPQLNALEAQVDIRNDTLKVFEARFTEARALVRASESARYPQVSGGAEVTGVKPSGNRAISSFHDSYADLALPVSASYEADVWGRIRSSIAASRASAQASAADVETARLSIHAELAADYVTLHGLDRDEELLSSAVEAYTRALELTQNRFTGGLASRADVAQAETQLETTRAQAVDAELDRALVEHAIAVLVGQPASTFSIPVSSLTTGPPDVPVGIPSGLLERRPDIAAAERRVAAANAQVGVAAAANYPLLTLSGGAGFESSAIGSLLTGVSSFWAIGPALVQNIFDAGKRHALADQARASYEEAAAFYQSAVLSAFREVEDQLATLRLLEREGAIQDRAVDASERSLMQATNRYQGGVTTYLEVVTAQTAALTNERVAARILARRMSASVLLLKVVGGGWNRQSLPTLTAGK
jgi:NodT family efflux transporter outer membrane factor (OMF) lipoprotein